jgi:flagellar biosynthesis/type III secretory pathway protein FliH
METFIESTKGAGYDEGLEAGIQQGIQQGLEQGNYQKSIETAKKMLELKKMSIEDISLCSGLPKETILQLKTQ